MKIIRFLICRNKIYQRISSKSNDYKFNIFRALNIFFGISSVFGISKRMAKTFDKLLSKEQADFKAKGVKAGNNHYNKPYHMSKTAIDGAYSKAEFLQSALFTFMHSYHKWLSICSFLIVLFVISLNLTILWHFYVIIHQILDYIEYNKYITSK